MTKMVFLDTNVCLHYQLFDQVDLSGVLNAETVKMLIPPATLFDSDRCRDLPSRPRIRIRAGKNGYVYTHPGRDWLDSTSGAKEDSDQAAEVNGEWRSGQGRWLARRYDRPGVGA